MSEARYPTGFAVLCRVGARVYAIAVEHVIETMRPLAIEPIPNAHSFVLGLSRIRGAPVPVVSIARMLGATESPDITRFVAIRVDGRCAALAVDSVLGVAALPRDTLEPLPPMMQEAAAHVVDAIGTLDSNLLFVLKSAHIVPESVFALVDAHRVGT